MLIIISMRFMRHVLIMEWLPVSQLVSMFTNYCIYKYWLIPYTQWLWSSRWLFSVRPGWFIFYTSIADSENVFRVALSLTLTKLCHHNLLVLALPYTHVIQKFWLFSCMVSICNDLFLLIVPADTNLSFKMVWIPGFLMNMSFWLYM